MLALQNTSPAVDCPGCPWKMKQYSALFQGKSAFFQGKSKRHDFFQGKVKNAEFIFRGSMEIILKRRKKPRKNGLSFFLGRKKCGNEDFENFEAGKTAEMRT